MTMQTMTAASFAEVLAANQDLDAWGVRDAQMPDVWNQKKRAELEADAAGFERAGRFLDEWLPQEPHRDAVPAFYAARVAERKTGGPVSVGALLAAGRARGYAVGVDQPGNHARLYASASSWLALASDIAGVHKAAAKERKERAGKARRKGWWQRWRS